MSVEPMIVVSGFEILQSLGKGSMGVVYKARDSSGMVIALKVLYPPLSSEQSYIKRFQAEADMATRLDHPNIVKVFRSGRSDSHHYIAMEYVDGTNLQEMIKDHGALPESSVAAVGMCVASALHHAWHRQRLIHRDIKPENLLISQAGLLKVCDLGIAKLMNEQRTALTRTGFSLGSPHYIAPEQARGEKDIDCGVDIYGLGATLYHAVTGQTVHQANSEFGLIIKHATVPVRDPREVMPQLSNSFAILLMKMLELDKSKRSSDWISVFEALEDIHREAENRENPQSLRISQVPA